MFSSFFPPLGETGSLEKTRVEGSAFLYLGEGFSKFSWRVCLCYEECSGLVLMLILLLPLPQPEGFFLRYSPDGVTRGKANNIVEVP